MLSFTFGVISFKIYLQDPKQNTMSSSLNATVPILRNALRKRLILLVISPPAADALE